MISQKEKMKWKNIEEPVSIIQIVCLEKYLSCHVSVRIHEIVTTTPTPLGQAITIQFLPELPPKYLFARCQNQN